MTPAELAQASNSAVYASMLVLTLAMVFFAFSFAAGRRRVTALATTEMVESEGGAAVITRTEIIDPIVPGRRTANIAMSLTWLGTALLLVGVVLRGLWAGRVPWGNMYEFSISAALGILVVYLAFSIKVDVR